MSRIFQLIFLDHDKEMKTMDKRELSYQAYRLFVRAIIVTHISCAYIVNSYSLPDKYLC